MWTKRILALGAAAAVLAGCLTEMADAPNTLYVSPDAGAVRDGSRRRPFATPQEAQRALRGILATNRAPWTVELAAGDYPVTEPLVFTPADSGTPDATVTWKGPAQGVARIAGARTLKGWRVRPDGRWETDVPTGADGKRLWFEQLFVNGVRAPRARHPNAGFLTPASVKETVVSNAAGKALYAVHGLAARPGDLAALAGTAPSAWKWAHLVVHHNWDSTRRIVAGFDVGTETFRTQGEPWKKWNPWRTNSLYYVENVPAALDAPGEWLYDGEAGKVVYIPRAGERPETADVRFPVPGLKQLVVFAGEPAKAAFVHDLVFENLAFAFTDSPRRPQFLRGAALPKAVTGDVGAPGPSQWPPNQASAHTEAAIVADGAHRVAFRDCALAHTGEYGLWLREGCVSNRLERCALEDLGAGGIRIGTPGATQKVGKGERVTRLANGRGTGYNVVDNCIVSHGGRVHAPGVAVWIGSSPFNSVTHCEISDFYYTGVSIGWVWGYSGSMAQGNTLAFCRIRKIGQKALGDMGGLYTLGTSFGTCVSNNVIHAVDSYTYGGWGLYPDEGSEGIVLENNLVYDTKDASFHQHYGRDNVLRNNILAFSREGQVAVTRAEPHRSLTAERNVILWDRGETFTKYNGTKSEKAKIDWKGNFWWKTSGEAVTFNGKTFAQWQAKGNDADGLVADPRFADPATRDFRLPADSPVVKAGFMPFAPSAAGVYGDAAWVRRADDTCPEFAERR